MVWRPSLGKEVQDAAQAAGWGDHGEEMGRGKAVGWRPDLQEKAQDAEEREAGRYGSWEF